MYISNIKCMLVCASPTANPYSYSAFEAQARVFDIRYLVQDNTARGLSTSLLFGNVHICMHAGKQETFSPTPFLPLCFQPRVATSALLAIVSFFIARTTPPPPVSSSPSSSVSVSYYWHRSSARQAPNRENSTSIWAIATFYPAHHFRLS